MSFLDESSMQRSLAAGKRIVLLALAAALAMPLPARASCSQDRAVYAEPDTGATLTFTPGATGAAAHAFALALKGGAIVLEAVVLPTEMDRPHGILMHQCPAGDVTGDELEACTIWQGPIYVVDAAGKAGLLAPDRALAAAGQIILPDFAAAVRQSSLWGVAGLSQLPSDVFSLSRCQQ